MSDLARRLTEATGLPAALAEAVIQTALERIRILRPDLSDRVDRVLADPGNAAAAVSWIVQLSQQLAPAASVPDPPDTQEPAPGSVLPRDS